MASRLESYFSALGECLGAATVVDGSGTSLGLSDAVERTVELVRTVHAAGGKLMFVGNGGSAGIASHAAIDYTKNGGLRALCFNDGAALTCYGNDLGFDQVFAAPILTHAAAHDLLIAISSSGRSPNILNAVAAARERRCGVVTLSGFSPDNPLRGLGDLNFHVASGEYGFVEISHMTLCHAVLDICMGWKPEHSEETL